MVRQECEFDGDLRQLASMRAFLREVCPEGEPGQDHQLALALTEAASNIILHSFQGQPQQAITMTIEVDDNQVRVTLQYTGTPFEPQQAVTPVFDGSQESGFGLYLIGQCVDDVQYRHDGQGQCAIHLVQNRQQRHKGEDHAAHG